MSAKVDEITFKWTEKTLDALKEFKENQIRLLERNPDEDIKNAFHTFANDKKSDFIGFTNEINLVEQGELKSYVFLQPLLIYWHKKLPCVFLINDFFKSMVLKNNLSKGSVKEGLKWVNNFKKASVNERKLEKVSILKQLIQSGVPSDFIDFLIKNCHLMGFSYNLRYYKLEEDSESNPRGIYVHPFGGPTLAFKQKNSPIVYLTSPSLAFNNSHLKMNEKNKINNQVILGITD